MCINIRKQCCNSLVYLYFSITQDYFKFIYSYNLKRVSIYIMFKTWKNLFTKAESKSRSNRFRFIVYSTMNNLFVQKYKGKITMENYWKPKELATQKQHSLQSKDQRLYHYKRARALTWKQIIQQEEWSDRRMEPTIKPALHLVFL